MKKKIFMLMLAASLLFTASFAFAADYRQDWSKSFQDNAPFLRSANLNPISSGGYIFTISDTLYKTDSSGIVILSKKVGIPLRALSIATDEGVYANTSVSTDSYICRFDSNFNLLWQKPSGYVIGKLMPTSDYGCIFSQLRPGPKEDYYEIIKVNSIGEKKDIDGWIFGMIPVTNLQDGSSVFSMYPGEGYPILMKFDSCGQRLPEIKIASEIKAVTTSGDYIGLRYPYNKIYIQDKNGKLRTSKNVGFPISYVAATKDGGFVCAGNVTKSDVQSGVFKGYSVKGESDCGIAKFDKNGNVEWKKLFGTSGKDEVNSINTDKNGGIAVASRLDFINAFSAKTNNIRHFTPVNRAPVAKSTDFKAKASNAGVYEAQKIRLMGSVNPNKGKLKRVFVNISLPNLYNTDFLYKEKLISSKGVYKLNTKDFPELKEGSGPFKQKGRYWIRLWAQNEGNAPTLLKEVKYYVDW